MGTCSRGHPRDELYANRTCAVCARDSSRAYREALRQAAFDAYGRVCACCGEGRLVFLTFDHVDGGGTAHRSSMTVPGGTFRWMRDNGYPPVFQTLCWNCNWAKHMLGACPHRLEREADNVVVESTT